jgi:hypothetical protein
MRLEEPGYEPEYVPDEGLPAFSVLCLHYRDAKWLKDNGVSIDPVASLRQSSLPTTSSPFQDDQRLQLKSQVLRNAHIDVP